MEPVVPIAVLSVLIGVVIALLFFKIYFLQRKSEVRSIAIPELHSDPKNPTKSAQPISRKSHSKSHSHCASDKDQNKRHHPLDLNTLKGHGDLVSWPCFSPDGRSLLFSNWYFVHC